MECGGQSFTVCSQLRTLVGLRLLRYDLFLRKAGCGTQL
jgi:hypothetical protein